MGNGTSPATQTLPSVRYSTARELVMLQARLYSPSYQSPGKWAIFNPTDRRAFAAVGKDALPGVVPILIEAGRGARSLEELAHVVAGTTLGQIERLAFNGLLHAGEHTGEASGNGSRRPEEPGFLHRYHLANYDYPFHDYFEDDWRERDRRLMHQYAKLWDPPPKMTRREGTFIPLPTVQIGDLRPGGSELSLDQLAAVLRFTFGPIGEIPGEFGPWLRKTSPSGGAKHPSEGHVVLLRPMDSVPRGVWAYDVERHGLVRQEVEEGVLAAFEGAAPSTVAVLVRSHVERPMWRYREIRSFRPIIIDSGHICETLSLLAGLCGMASRVEPAVPLGEGHLSWIREPELAMVLIGPADVLRSFTVRRALTPHPVSPDDSGRYVTNPTLTCDFGPEGLAGSTSWPARARVTLTLDDFECLTHALPSRRRDRDTTVDGLSHAAHLGSARVELLADRGLLLPETYGRQVYGHLDLWVRHGWYLSFLAHAEIRSRLPEVRQEPAAQVNRLDSLADNEVQQALLRRRTTRVFRRHPVERFQVERILRDLVGGDFFPGRIFVGSMDITDLAAGLYEWSPADGFQLRRTSATREEIRRLTVGQSPAGEGAATIWLVRRVDLQTPESYEASLVDLGRAGQRICLRVTSEALGVFLTPAVLDAATYDYLAVEEPLAHVCYAFTIGPPA